MRKSTILILLFSTLILSRTHAQFSGGTGSVADPYQIASLVDLNTLSSSSAYWTSHYIQTADIDATATASQNAGEGFVPIGNATNTFQGSYNGQGYKIAGLTVNRPASISQALFGEIFGATIENLTLEGAVVNGSNQSGGIVGWAGGDATLQDLTIDATSTVTGIDNVGGIVGLAQNTTITNCAAHATVDGNDNTGGLVGFFENNGSAKTMSGCVSTGTVTADGDRDGALIGENEQTVEDCYSTASLTSLDSTGDDDYGGLIGYNDGGTVRRCYATGMVSASGNNVGGLIGRCVGSSVVENCFSLGMASGNDDIGGLIGELAGGAVSLCYSSAKVTSPAYGDVGGLVGNHDDAGATVADCYWIDLFGDDLAMNGDEGNDVSLNIKQVCNVVRPFVNHAVSDLQGNLAQTTMAAFDFTNVWQNDPGGTPGSFPVLRNLPVPAGAPVGPTAFTADGADGLVNLAWFSNTETDIAAYKIYRSTTAGFTPAAANLLATIPHATGGLVYADNGGGNLPAPVNDTLYHYMLAAVDGDGNESIPHGGAASPGQYTATVSVAIESNGVTYGDAHGNIGPDVHAVYTDSTGGHIISTHTDILDGCGNDQGVNHEGVSGTVQLTVNPSGLQSGQKWYLFYDDNTVAGYPVRNTTGGAGTGTTLVTGSGNNPVTLTVGVDGNFTDYLFYVDAPPVNNTPPAINGLADAFVSLAPFGLARNVTLTDQEFALINAGVGNYNDCSLVVRRLGGASDSDIFQVVPTDINYVVTAGAIEYAGKQVASYTTSGGTLTVHFSGVEVIPTQTIVNNIVQHLTYHHSNAGTIPPQVSLEWTFSDGLLSVADTQLLTLSYYSGGKGTMDDPWQIANLDDLKALSQSTVHWGDYFIQTADIDASATAFFDDTDDDGDGDKYNDTDDASGSGGNDGFSPIGNAAAPFTGSFDGQDFSISSLTIARPSQSLVGFFGVTDGATIEQVSLTGVNITGGTSTGGLVGQAKDTPVTGSSVAGAVTGGSNTGGLIGLNELVSTAQSVSDCFTTGTVTSNGDDVGGLIGDNGQSVSDCYSTATVTSTDPSGDDSYGGLVGLSGGAISRSYATGNVTASGNDVGGLVGQAENCHISESYASGLVTGNNNCGGLVGFYDNNSATVPYQVQNCYARGNVVGVADVGGLIGEAQLAVLNSYSTGSASGSSGVGGLVGNLNGTTSSNCFWDTQTSGNSTSAAGTGKTTLEMKQMCTYADATWDFEAETANGTDEIWTLNPVDNNGYPALSFQDFSHAVLSDGGTIGSNQEICIGFVAATLTNLALPSGQTGNLEFQWQYSVDSLSFVDIAGEIDSTFVPGSVFVDTWYRRLSRVSCDTVWVASNVVSVRMNCNSIFMTQWHFPSAATSLQFKTLTEGGAVDFAWYCSPSGNNGTGSFTKSTYGLHTLSGLTIDSGDTLFLNMKPGKLRRFAIDNSANKTNLLDVSNWGDVPWTSMEDAFKGCTNLNISATDIPDLSSVTNMNEMFYYCSSLTGPANIGDWNTASVTTMNRMFYYATSFNQPIGNWNTGQVTDMNYMFRNAPAFNQPIGDWNTAAVTDMNNMFCNATAFDQAIGDWNTSAVTNMSYMFYNAAAFNQPIDSLNTAAVTNMSYMFGATSAFNQPIGSWNTGQVTDMNSMFYSAAAFNQPIGSWNTGQVTNMSSMFYNAVAFNQPVGNWNTSAVTNMSSMFYNAAAFNQPIGSWSLKTDVDLSGMLDSCGMDCINYSATLIGWQANPATPTARTLGSAGLKYGSDAQSARDSLVLATASGGEGWTITGDTLASSATAMAVTANPSTCVNAELTSVTHTTTLATGIGTPTGLPPGMTASWSSDTITISGTPTLGGIFNYDIPLLGECGTASATGTISVWDVAGMPLSITSDTICWNTPVSSISLPSDSVGFDYQWQFSEDNVNWTDIEGDTMLTLSPQFLQVSTWFRLELSLAASACVAGFSDTSRITVLDPFTPSYLSTTDSVSSVCHGATPTLVATPTFGGSGPTYLYQWQQSLNGGPFTNVGTPNSGTDPNSYTLTTGLTADASFRLIAFDEGPQACGASFSSVNLNLTVLDSVSAGAIAGTDTICAGDTPAPLSSVTAGTGGGTISYRWEQNDNLSTPSWQVMTDSTGPGLVLPALTMTTQYRRTTLSDEDGFTCSSVPSNVVTVTVEQLPTATAGGLDTVCVNDTAFVAGAAVTDGTIQWSHNGSGSLLGDTTLTPGYLSVTADAGDTVRLMLVATTSGACVGADTAYYSVLVDGLPDAGGPVTDTVCVSDSVLVSGAMPAFGSLQWTHDGAGSLTNATTATPTYVPDASEAGDTVRLLLVVTSDNFCALRNPAPDSMTYTLLLDVPPVATAGDTATICPDGVLTVAGASVTNAVPFWTHNGNGTLSGDTTLTPTYTATAADVGTTVTLTLEATGDAGCNTLADTALYTIEVLPAIVPAAVPADRTICYYLTSTLVATPASGGSGTFRYQWQVSEDSLSWSDVANGGTNTTYTTTQLPSDRWYRLLTIDTAMTAGAANCDSVPSTGVVKVKVNDPLFQPFLSGTTDTLCAGETPTISQSGTPITVSPATGGTGPFLYTWQRSATGGNPWTNLGTQSANLDYPADQPLNASAYLRVVGYDSGNPTCGSIFSNYLNVTVDPKPTAAITGANGTCNGDTITLQASGGLSFRWSTGDTIAAVQVAPTVQTSYSVTVTNSFGCTDADTTLVGVDTVSPTAVCQDISLYLDAMGMATLPAADIDNGSTDACGIDTMYLDKSSFSCADIGTVTVTLTVRDSSQNTASCTADVAVSDTVAPTALCRDLTLYLDATGNATLTAAQVDSASTDACGGIDTMYIDLTSFACTDLGPHTVTLTVTDSSMNSAICTATITVLDTVSPAALCRDLTLYLDATGNVATTAAAVDSSSTDACGIDTRTLDVSAFTCTDLGPNTVTLTVTDSSMNISTCTATLTVLDTVAPTATCQAHTLYLDASGMGSLTAALVDNGSTDACGGIDTMWVDKTSFVCADLGTVTVTLTVADGSMNTATCTATITVLDTVAPTALCADPTVYLDVMGIGSLTAAEVDSASADACGIADRQLSQTGFGPADLGAVAVTLSVTDSSGNTSTC
ncbi:MAG: hypothetical protein RLY31_1387, partial [Bacteroidota bacterium]